MRLHLKKLPGGTLVPDDESTAERLALLANGTILAMDAVKPRNYEFHKRYFALLNYAFSCWEPVLGEHKGKPIQKNFERFRKDVAIACGFYDLVTNIMGDTRAEAKSISFASMEEDEFNKLYQSTITLFIGRFQILQGYRSWEEVDAIINNLLGYA